VETEPLLAEPTEEGLLAAVEPAAVVVVGISPQDVESHQAFTAHHGLTVPLLADVDRAVARSFGVARDGVAGRLQGVQRAVFVVDEDGIVGYRHVHRLGLDYQNADDLREALGSLPARA